jgi:hypothetical protein
MVEFVAYRQQHRRAQLGSDSKKGDGLEWSASEALCPWRAAWRGTVLWNIFRTHNVIPNHLKKPICDSKAVRSPYAPVSTTSVLNKVYLLHNGY